MNKRELTLILGGTKGLGAELAKACLDKGHEVAIAGSSVSRVGDTDLGTAFPCDLTDVNRISEFFKAFEMTYERPPDNFFWVAGRLLKGDLAAQSADEVLKTIDINFRNAVLVAHHFWSQMINTEQPAKIVVIASSSGVNPRSDEAIYVATKHAQVGFARSIGLENDNVNLQVSLFLPGGMQTPFWDKNPQDNFSDFLDPKKVADKILELIETQPLEHCYAEYTIPRGSL